MQMKRESMLPCISHRSTARIPRKHHARHVCIIGMMVLLMRLVRFDQLSSIQYRANNSVIVGVKTDSDPPPKFDISSFLEKDVDSSKGVICGNYKCFYQSKSNPLAGYLIMRETKTQYTQESRMNMLKGGWSFAQKLQARYDIPHFLSSPPINMTVSQHLSYTLNQNLKSQETTKYNYTGKVIFREGKTVAIQPCILAPKPHLIIGGVEGKLVEFEQHVDKFLSLVIDKAAFSRHFSRDMGKMMKAIEHEPCLAYDFQAMVDLDGHLHNIDLDRCFDRFNASNKVSTSTKKVQECIQAMEHIEGRVQSALAESSAVSMLLSSNSTTSA